MTTGRMLLIFCRAVCGVALVGALNASAVARALGTAPLWPFLGANALYLLGWAGEYLCLKRYFPEGNPAHRINYVISVAIVFVIVALGYLFLFKF